MKIIGNGYIKVGSPTKTVEIDIDQFNAMNISDWELVDVYWKEGCYTTLWRHRETGEEAERIGTRPPSELLKVEGYTLHVTEGTCEMDGLVFPTIICEVEEDN